MKKITIFLTLLSLLFLAGCGMASAVGMLGTPTHHEQKIPAEYELTEQPDQKILVLVKQPVWLNTNTNLRYHLTKAINKRLTQKAAIPTENLITYNELALFRSTKTGFSSLSPPQVGAALNADTVMSVTIEDYQLSKMVDTEYYEGYLRTRAVLFDTATGEKLWPKLEKSKSVKVGFDIESAGRKIADARLVAACAHCTVRYLYNCPMHEFRIAEDRSRISWESDIVD
jgi:hypothetical protein